MTDERSNGAGSGESPAEAPGVADAIEENLGGVQGSPPPDNQADGPVQVTAPARPGSPGAEPAPDAAEIEWAGGLLRKPPNPSH